MEPGRNKGQLTHERTWPERYVRAQHPHCTQRWASRRDPPRFGRVVLVPAGCQVSSDPRKALRMGEERGGSLELTPIPLMNKQTRHSTKPRVPSTYAFAIPNKAIENGINQVAPNWAALSRSSATHFPPLFLRHFITMRSETRPASGAPTCHMGKNGVRGQGDG